MSCVVDALLMFRCLLGCFLVGCLVIWLGNGGFGLWVCGFLWCGCLVGWTVSLFFSYLLPVVYVLKWLGDGAVGYVLWPLQLGGW